MSLKIEAGGWWERQTYTDSSPIPTQVTELAGPRGVALVSVYGEGATQKGWGEEPPNGSTDAFMPRYMRDEFSQSVKEANFIRKGMPFAIVMRSVQLVCVDIDGKNGGLEFAGRLGALPLTLAETSKSGNGYHLFYKSRDSWHSEELGFGMIPDRISITTGVDIRGTGCVYHYPSQRWNSEEIAELPQWLEDKLLAEKKRRQATRVAMQKISTTLDTTEKLMAHAALFEELQQPIPAGRRNNTLFAIGSQLVQAGVEDWEGPIRERATKLNLSSTEIDKLVANIGKYGMTA